MAALAAVALFALAASLFAVRRARSLAAEVAELREQLAALSGRLEAAENDVTHALASADVAETVLLDKGVADEEDLEAARRRFGEDGQGYARPRDGEVH